LAEKWSSVYFPSAAGGNEAKLENQPTGTKLEYRVKAINKSGEGQASNTVIVVL